MEVAESNTAERAALCAFRPCRHSARFSYAKRILGLALAGRNALEPSDVEQWRDENNGAQEPKFRERKQAALALAFVSGLLRRGSRRWIGVSALLN